MGKSSVPFSRSIREQEEMQGREEDEAVSETREIGEQERGRPPRKRRGGGVRRATRETVDRRNR